MSSSDDTQHTALEPVQSTPAPPPQQQQQQQQQKQPPPSSSSSLSLPPLSILVFISGSGTNLQALIDAFNGSPSSSSSLSSSSPSSPSSTPSNSAPLSHLARITHVLSNKKSAYGLTRAKNANIPTTYHNLVPYKHKYPNDMPKARQSYDADLASIAIAQSPDLVVCAGWMHILSSAFLSPLASRGIPIINLHPALPGQFDGANAIERAWKAFQNGELKGGKTGVMVHYVVEEVDKGKPILVEEVECRVGESLEGLEERMHKVEWRVIVEATSMVVEGIRKERGG